MKVEFRERKLWRCDTDPGFSNSFYSSSGSALMASLEPTLHSRGGAEIWIECKEEACCA
jgi:hypothetical protein